MTVPSHSFLSVTFDRGVATMTTLVITARTPSDLSFDSSQTPDDDFDVSLLEDAVEILRSHRGDGCIPETSVSGRLIAGPSGASQPPALSIHESDARTKAVMEAAKTITSLREELADANRRLDAYRGARMASKLVHDEKTNKNSNSKSALHLLEDNPALAIPARFRLEKILDAELLSKEHSKLLLMTVEVAKQKVEAELSIEAARAESALIVAQSKQEVKLATDKLQALTQSRNNLAAALLDTRTALGEATKQSHGFERESKSLYDRVLATQSIAEQSRANALADAAAQRASAREKLFGVLRNMGQKENSTETEDASHLDSARLDPYAYAARLRDMRVG